jgi:organic radical activating enzyme
MTHLWNPLHRLFTPIHPIPAGMYHYQSPPDDPRNYRLHLRLEKDGGGILIVNAATILHLNQTAAEYAYYLIKNEPVDEVTKKMVARYHVNPAQAREDYVNLTDRIQILINTPDLDPVTFLDFERQQPFSGSLSAPYRLDCALTYRLPSDEPIEAAPTERVSRELSLHEWIEIIDKAWKAGIPHIVFTGGEPTLRDDLSDLIAHTEANGQVSGLLTDGLRLSDRAYLDKLLRTGLDHLLIVLQPDYERSWQAVENAMVEDLSVAVHLTVTKDNSSRVVETLERISGIGVKQISLSANDASLSELLKSAREKAASLHLELVWNLPVPYSAMHPVALEVGDAQIEGAGRAWLYVEPDGDVLAAQGAPQVLGNLLRDPWEKIWKGRD